jgi:hypothetical protein
MADFVAVSRRTVGKYSREEATSKQGEKRITTTRHGCCGVVFPQ